MNYDQETRDLANLAANRVSNAVNSVLQICDGQDQALQVALMAAGAALGSACGSVSAKYGCTHEEAKMLLADLILKAPSQALSGSKE